MINPSLLPYPRTVLCTDTGGYQCVEQWEEYEAMGCEFDRTLNTTVLLIRLPDSGILRGVPSRLFIDTIMRPEAAKPASEPPVYADDPEAGIF